ncbi:uncharacterized protein KY384_002697 [Bacidia gigantensis]|uniref:uncharacterized protein n=1 Tax=Bacidia gigantensis TaxID=2732470 RepID=UPI001D03E241|nr:uncharacterized protein KY384_002697 [Bacidia gigantensis]KAG8532819.1 hypothetical protein KY384_002697 [Bacidia gigantensis]
MEELWTDMLLVSDRPLQHINKKGRPVSQCPHCRGLRKSRATHAACECGSKPHKKEDHAEERSESDQSDTAEQPSCCCSHGMKCTCALKKEPLDPVPEFDDPRVAPMRTLSNKKPRLAKAGSETSLTIFTNGHHKPTHRHNDSAHKLGMPYKVPIPHSVPGGASARRSTDSLPLYKGRDFSSRVDIPAIAPNLRSSRSEHGSPLPRSTDQLAPLDFNFSLMGNAPQYSDAFQSSFYTPSEDFSSYPSGLNVSPPADWSAIDLPLDEFSASYQQSQPQQGPYGFEPPNAATNSSGQVSEVSDYLSSAPSRPALSNANSDESQIPRLSPPGYLSTAQRPQSRPTLSTASSDSSNISQLSQPNYLASPQPTPSRPDLTTAYSNDSNVNRLASPPYLGARQQVSPRLDMGTACSDDSSIKSLPPPSYVAAHQAMSPNPDLTTTRTDDHKVDLSPTSYPSASHSFPTKSEIAMTKSNEGLKKEPSLSPHTSAPQNLPSLAIDSSFRYPVELPRPASKQADSSPELSFRPTTASPTEVQEASPGRQLGSEAFERHGTKYILGGAFDLGHHCQPERDIIRVTARSRRQLVAALTHDTDHQPLRIMIMMESTEEKCSILIDS